MELPPNPSLADRLRFAAQVVDQVTPLIAPFTGLINADNLRNQAAREDREAQEKAAMIVRKAAEEAQRNDLYKAISLLESQWTVAATAHSNGEQNHPGIRTRFIARGLINAGWRKWA